MLCRLHNCEAGSHYFQLTEWEMVLSSNELLKATQFVDSAAI